MKQSYPYIFDKRKRKLPDDKALTLMPRELVKEFQAFVVKKSGDKAVVAAVNPNHSSLRSFINERFNKVEWFLAKQDDISFVLDNYAQNFQDEISRLVEFRVGTNGNIIELVDLILSYSFKEQASDVHIEPGKDESVVRFRVDGILHKVLSLPKDMHSAVIARFKILANLKIDDYRHPQDGRIEMDKFSDISLRISTMPTLHGEKVALRVLDDSHKDLAVRNLGFSEEHEKILLRNIEKPFGMIITSGPTGSGKTTTLYGVLNVLAKDRINISTLEDPIEYSFKGVNQVQINPRANLTFASGLRALLRQDPDIIMVGEIRDSETAIMAGEAALTGHLVLTTLHTNDAPSVITRFLEMKVEEFTIGSTINVIIAQRLVRKVCQHCSKKEKINETILNKIKERKDILDALKLMKKNINNIAKESFSIGKGCDACMNTGYRGRIGIFEMLEISKSIHDLILERSSSEKIRNEARKHGFKDMIVDGLEKVFAGTTTLEEVLRATRNE